MRFIISCIQKDGGGKKDREFIGYFIVDEDNRYIRGDMSSDCDFGEFTY